MNAPVCSTHLRPRLTSFHRRCLDKRVGECNEALAQAVSAFAEAGAWEPNDASLPVACDLLQAAQKLTELARHVRNEGPDVLSGPGRRVCND